MIKKSTKNAVLITVLKAGVEENYTVESMMKRVHQMVSQGASAKRDCRCNQ